MPRNKKRQQKKLKYWKAHAAAAALASSDDNRERTFQNEPAALEAVPEQAPEAGPSSAEVWSQYETAVKCRTVLEFALLSLVVPQQTPEQPKMPNPSSNPSPPQPKGGWERLMNPVQDLGRSLLNFLVGGSNTGNVNQQQPEASGSSQGRQRPLGHPANPSTHSTPVILRRTGPPPNPAKHEPEEDKGEPQPPGPAPVTARRRKHKNSSSTTREAEPSLSRAVTAPTATATPPTSSAPINLPVLKKVELTPSCSYSSSFDASSSYMLPVNKTGPSSTYAAKKAFLLSSPPAATAASVPRQLTSCSANTFEGNRATANSFFSVAGSSSSALGGDQRHFKMGNQHSSGATSKLHATEPTSRRSRSRSPQVVMSSRDAAMPDRLSKLVASSSEEAFFTATSTTPRTSVLIDAKPRDEVTRVSDAELNVTASTIGAEAGVKTDDDSASVGETKTCVPIEVSKPEIANSTSTLEVDTNLSSDSVKNVELKENKVFEKVTAEEKIKNEADDEEEDVTSSGERKPSTSLPPQRDVTDVVVDVDETSPVAAEAENRSDLLQPPDMIEANNDSSALVSSTSASNADEAIQRATFFATAETVDGGGVDESEEIAQMATQDVLIDNDSSSCKVAACVVRVVSELNLNEPLVVEPKVDVNEAEAEIEQKICTEGELVEAEQSVSDKTEDSAVNEDQVTENEVLQVENRLEDVSAVDQVKAEAEPLVDAANQLPEPDSVLQAVLTRSEGSGEVHPEVEGADLDEADDSRDITPTPQAAILEDLDDAEESSGVLTLNAIVNEEVPEDHTCEVQMAESQVVSPSNVERTDSEQSCQPEMAEKDQDEMRHSEEDHEQAGNLGSSPEEGLIVADTPDHAEPEAVSDSAVDGAVVDEPVVGLGAAAVVGSVDGELADETPATVDSVVAEETTVDESVVADAPSADEATGVDDGTDETVVANAIEVASAEDATVDDVDGKLDHRDSFDVGALVEPQPDTAGEVPEAADFSNEVVTEGVDPPVVEEPAPSQPVNDEVVGSDDDVTEVKPEVDSVQPEVPKEIPEVTEEEKMMPEHLTNVSGEKVSTETETEKVSESENLSDRKVDVENSKNVSVESEIVDAVLRSKDHEAQAPATAPAAAPTGPGLFTPPPPPPPPPPGFLPCLEVEAKKPEKRHTADGSKRGTLAEQALLKKLESISDDTFVGFLKSNLPVFSSTRDRSEEAAVV